MYIAYKLINYAFDVRYRVEFLHECQAMRLAPSTGEGVAAG